MTRYVRPDCPLDGVFWLITQGGGGDFCLPGSEYQPLHSDSGDASKQELDQDGNIVDILPLDAEERPVRTQCMHQHRHCVTEFRHRFATLTP